MHTPPKCCKVSGWFSLILNYYMSHVKISFIALYSASVYRYVLESEHMKKFFDYIQLPNFDIASDAAATFKVEYYVRLSFSIGWSSICCIICAYSRRVFGWLAIWYLYIWYIALNNRLSIKFRAKEAKISLLRDIHIGILVTQHFFLVKMKLISGIQWYLVILVVSSKEWALGTGLSEIIYFLVLICLFSLFMKRLLIVKL